MPSKALKARRNRNDPSFPLDPKREAFCSAICKGMKLRDAHRAAGYQDQTDQAAFQLRHREEVDARIRFLLQERVKADARSFARRQKVKGDLLDATLRRLADIAHTDPREIFAWREEATVNEAGEVIGTAPRLIVRDSKDISAAAATLIKGAFLKAGEVKIETHDQRAALVELAKLLKGSDAAPPPNVTVNQVNVGGVDALAAASRVAFLLSSALARAPAAAPEIKTIEGEAVPNS